MIDIALGDEAELAAQTEAAAGPILIACTTKPFRSRTSFWVTILVALKFGTAIASTWCGFFDRSGTSWQFSQVPQLLLDGDSASLIG